MTSRRIGIIDDLVPYAADRYAHPRSVEEYRSIVTVELDTYGMCRNAKHLDQCLWRLRGRQYPMPDWFKRSDVSQNDPAPPARLLHPDNSIPDAPVSTALKLPAQTKLSTRAWVNDIGVWSVVGVFLLAVGFIVWTIVKPAARRSTYR
jgi:hypothetical protein